MTDTPQVYIACLACYNEGRASGSWQDADDADTLRESIALMQAECGHTDQDWAIHDYNGFGTLAASLGENPNLDDLVALAFAIVSHGDGFLEYAADVGVESALESFEEAYCGEYDSPEDYAREYADDLGITPGTAWPLYCIDWEYAARELFTGDYTYSNGHVWRAL